jgi:hypothetical protein
MSGNVIEGNYVGTDVTGTVALGADAGQNSQIEGTGIIANNVFSGLGSVLALWCQPSVPGTLLVQNNFFGTDATGTKPLPNGFIYPGGLDVFTQLGGPGAGTIVVTGNTFAFNDGPGILADGDTGASVLIENNTIHDNTGPGVISGQGPGVQIERNSIYANGDLGIDLTPHGEGDSGLGDLVRLNAANDAANHVGPNNLMNFPILTSAYTAGGTTTISGGLDTGTVNGQPFLANATITLDFYANAAPDPTGYGQGQTWLGSCTVATDSTGHLVSSPDGSEVITNGQFTTTLNMPVPGGESYLTATATDASGDTSEFSADIPLAPTSGGPYTIRAGDSLTLLAGAAGARPWAYSWTVNGHANAVQGQNSTLNWLQLQALGVDGSATPFVVQAVGTDNQGSVQLPAASLTVLNVPPAAAITDSLPTDDGGNPTATAGSSITLTSNVNDPSAADTAAGFTTDWTVVKHAVPTGQGSNFVHAVQYVTRDLGVSSAQPQQDTFGALGAPGGTIGWGPSNPDPAPFLAVGFDTPVYADGVTIWENAGVLGLPPSSFSGFVTRVDLLDVRGQYHTLWSGTDPNHTSYEVPFPIAWPATSYLVEGVRIYTTAQSTGVNIDAVQLSGSYDSTANGSLPLSGAYDPSVNRGRSDQYATSVLSASSHSQLTSPGPWSASQAVGAPNVVGTQDTGLAWAPASENETQETLALGFAISVYADGVTIRENQGNGFVTGIDLLDTDGTWHSVWTGTDPTLAGAPADFRVNWTETSYLVTGVRIHVNTNHNLFSYEEIDSVQLHGWFSPGTVVASGTGPSLTFTPDATGTYFVTLTATDTNGNVGTTQATIDVATTLPPTAHITSPTYSSGQVHLTLAGSDPSSSDQAAGFTYTLDWGDGTAQNPDTVTVPASPGNASGVTLGHAYAPGTYTAALTATDTNGQVSAIATAVLVISTTAGDDITLSGGSGGGQLFITTATSPATPYDPTDLVFVTGQGGSDIYTVDFGTLLTTPIVLAGSGSDTYVANGSSGDNNFVKTTGSPSTISWGPQVGSSTLQPLETVSYSGTANLFINGGQGKNYIQDPGSNTTINAGPGQNTIVITATSGNGVVINGSGGSDTYIIDLGSLAGPVTINNSSSNASDSLIVNGAPGNNTIAAVGNQITSGTQTITVAAPLVNLTLAGGSGNNQITVSSVSVPIQNLAVDGGGGTNTITLNNVGPNVTGLTISAGCGGPGSTQVQTQGSLPIALSPVPNVGAVTGPSAGIPGQPLTFSAPFSLAGAASTDTVVWSWGDGTTTTQTISATSATLSATHAYAVTNTAPYALTLTVTNGDGLSAAARDSVLVTQSIYVLDPAASGALSISGNASITIPGTIVVDSTSKTALAESGNAQVTASSIQVVGGVQKSGNAKLSPAATTGIIAVADPLASLAAPTSGVARGSVNLTKGALTINPGIYSAISVSGNAALTLNPGVYILAGGGLTVSGNGSISGSGVMLYNTQSNFPSTGGTYGGIALSGNGTFNLVAPTSGPYAGVVVFQNRANTRAVSLSGNAAEGLGGTVYAPAALLYLSGNASLAGPVVVDELSLSGNAASTQSADGSDVSAGGVAGQLLAGNVTVYVDDANGFLTADEMARIQDAVNAVNAVNAVVQSYGVSVTETSDSTLANVFVDAGNTSAAGGLSDGVLGCYTSSGEITLIVGWNWYAGSDPTLIGATQYNFQTTVTHELGHALGLGHSGDPTSAMFATLTPGATIRTLTTADLNIPDAGAVADAQHAAPAQDNARPDMESPPPGSSPTNSAREFGPLVLSAIGSPSPVSTATAVPGAVRASGKLTILGAAGQGLALPTRAPVSASYLFEADRVGSSLLAGIREVSVVDAGTNQLASRLIDRRPLGQTVGDPLNAACPHTFRKLPPGGTPDSMHRTAWFATQEASGLAASAALLGMDETVLRLALLLTGVPALTLARPCGQQEQARRWINALAGAAR